MNDINLRKVFIDDEDLLFQWRNIDELIALSYLKKKVTLVEHSEWFSHKLNNPLSNLRIIQFKNKDIGLIRMESLEKGCEVSIYLIPGNEGKGFGFKALSNAINENESFNTFYANVQLKNIPSQKLFLKLSFIEVSRNSEFIQYKRSRK